MRSHKRKLAGLHLWYTCFFGSIVVFALLDFLLCFFFRLQIFFYISIMFVFKIKTIQRESN